jgi:hypothetical protein
VIVRAAPPEHFDWILSRTGCARTDGFRAIEAVDPDGRIRGMVAFDLWTVNSVQMHLALEAPVVLRSLLRPAFTYVFEESDRGVAIGIVPAHNARALELDKHIGFREAHRIKDGWAPGDDLVVLEMRKHECRWLRRKAT